MDVCIVDVVVIGREKGTTETRAPRSQLDLILGTVGGEGASAPSYKGVCIFPTPCGSERQTGQGLPPCVVIEEGVSNGKPSARRIAYCFDTLP